MHCAESSFQEFLEKPEAEKFPKVIGESQGNTRFSLSKNLKLKSTKITKPLSSSFCFASGFHSCDFTAALATLRSSEPGFTRNFHRELNLCHFSQEGKKKMHKPQPWP